MAKAQEGRRKSHHRGRPRSIYGLDLDKEFGEPKSPLAPISQEDLSGIIEDALEIEPGKKLPRS